MSDILQFTKKQKLIQEVSRAVSYKDRQCHPLGGKDGALTSPPRILVEQHKEEAERRVIIAAEKKRDHLPENIVNLRDLADGTWLSKNQKARALKRKELLIQAKKKKTKDREVIRDVKNTRYNLFLDN